MSEVEVLMRELGEAARAARAPLGLASTAARDQALVAAAAAIRANRVQILAANALDMEQARSRGLSAALLDRLKLDDKRVEAMAHGIDEIVTLPDPIGGVMAEWTRPIGL